jgi:hypothetical protein
MFAHLCVLTPTWYSTELRDLGWTIAPWPATTPTIPNANANRIIALQVQTVSLSNENGCETATKPGRQSAPILREPSQ